MSDEVIEYRAGLIALVGLANVGKSTLINRVIGEKIAIVSPKPQTTRNTIFGIRSEPNYQAIFVDTPGFHTPKTTLNKIIVQEVLESISFVDLICILCDAGEKIGNDFKRLLELAKVAPQPKMLIITKVDLYKKPIIYQLVDNLNKLCDFKHIVPISAIKDINIDTFLNLAVSELPVNIPQYDTDMVTTQKQQFLISEYVREQVFIHLRNEVPYDTYVDIEDFSETNSKMEISAIIYVGRESQKGILIGEGGSMMKKIGIASRESIESFFGKKVNLRLYVKTKENWVEKDDFMHKHD